MGIGRSWDAAGLVMGGLRSARAVDSAPKRLARVLAAAEPRGATAILLGDSGIGKAYLAEQAAQELSARIEFDCDAVVLPPPPHPSSGMLSVFAADLAGGAENEEDPTTRSRELLARLME